MANRRQHYRKAWGEDAEFSAIATQPLLQKSQAVALLEGLFPRGNASNDSFSYLEEYAPVIAVLNAAEKEKKISFPCSPRQLVAWARKSSEKFPVALPEPFIVAVDNACTPTVRKRLPLPLTDERIDIRNKTPTRGRVSPNGRVLIQGHDPRIACLARDIAVNIARTTGRAPSKKQVDYKLAEKLHCPVSRVVRRYSKKQAWTYRDIRKAISEFRDNQEITK